MEFHERFERLDPDVWTDAYLPAWSSRAAAAATFTVGPAGLVLSIPTHQPLWCPDLHPSPLRVSAIQSANRSGPVGSTDAPQPFLVGQRVREQQPTVFGFTPHHGSIAVTCSARLSARSMFSAWMVGLEDEPHRSGEICIVEVFGHGLRDGRAAVGQGVHPFRDPTLRDDFTAEPRVLDIRDQHTYQVDWRPDQIRFSVDGVHTRTSEQAPDYPMMLIIGVFDFPDLPGSSDQIPRLHVASVNGTGPASDGLR